MLALLAPYLCSTTNTVCGISAPARAILELIRSFTMASSLSTPTRLALCLLGLLLVCGAVTTGRSVSVAQNDSNATGTPTPTTTQNANAGASVSLPQQAQ